MVPMNSARRDDQRGFTLIELMVIAVITGILATVVLFAHSGVEAKNRNARREANVDGIKHQLETYYSYSPNGKYPTLANINDPAWRHQNLKELDDRTIQDPRWSPAVKACVNGGKPVFVNSPTDNCYAYQVTSSDGSPCDNAKVDCAQYTLTAKLEGGEKYVKTSLN